MKRKQRRQQQNKSGVAEKAAEKAPTARISHGQQSLPVGDALALATRHHGAGDLATATELYRKILEADPNQAAAHSNMGLALQSLDRTDDAVACFRRALVINADYTDAHLNLGIAYEDLGRLDDAIASYRRALALAPELSEAHYCLGNALEKRGDLNDAEASFRAALRINPDFAEAHTNLGNVLRAKGMLDDAVANHQAALAINPNLAEAHLNFGNALEDQGQMDEALACYQKALAIDPEMAEAHYNLGFLHHGLGKLDRAVEFYRNALSIRPDYGIAFRDLVRIIDYSGNDAGIEAAEQVFAAAPEGSDQRMQWAFGLGEVFNDLKQYGRAFDYFAEANRINSGGCDFSIDAFGNFVHRMCDIFSPDLFSRHRGSGHSDETPIFILGMPRTGSTLVEQILSSHPDVHGAGELETLRTIRQDFGNQPGQREFPEFVQDIDPDKLRELGVRYTAEIRKLSGTARFITDKMPRNFESVGLIKLILPKAKVIHCTRSPMDTCLSIFKSGIAAGRGYCRDLVTLGQYFNLYRELMAHWENVIPGFMLGVEYEALVSDQIGQTKAILDFCGLDWDDRCLAFNETDRSVRTASREQVRYPIYADSIQSSQRYEEQLAPLREVLCEGEPPVSPAKSWP